MIEKLNWMYIKNREGWYSLSGSQKIFFNNKKGEVYLFIPEDQYYALANSVEWADSKFEIYEAQSNETTKMH